MVADPLRTVTGGAGYGLGFKIAGCGNLESARIGRGRTENAADDRAGTAFAPVRGDGGTVSGMWTRTEPVMIGTIRRMPPMKPVPVGKLSES
jgi:hypothetical protein